MGGLNRPAVFESVPLVPVTDASRSLGGPQRRLGGEELGIPWMAGDHGGNSFGTARWSHQRMLCHFVAPIDFDRALVWDDCCMELSLTGVSRGTLLVPVTGERPPLRGSSLRADLYITCRMDGG